MRFTCVSCALVLAGISVVSGAEIIKVALSGFYKQHPVKHAKGRAKLDGALVAEVISDTPRKMSCSRL